MRHHLLNTALLTALLFTANASMAQLATPNAAGVTAGHTHLIVPDKAKHTALWQSLGGTVGKSGTLDYIAFPGMYILLREGKPEAPSIETSMNHVGFSVQDYAAYKAKLLAAGATIFYDSEKDGQILADLPDGVRVEVITDKAQAQPIVFHHSHEMAADGKALQQWYINVFGAEAGERRGLPSAVIPGGRVDILGVREGQAAPRGSKGNAIDHIGFDVVDMNKFAEHLKSLGLKFDVEPRVRDDIGLTIAFITDPAGTYIEVTQGMVKFN
jgi:catechol 2,3-dioxygenase-like lactoylglutathione lyase family enzyme